MTLAELLVTIAILGVAVLTAFSSYRFISTSIQHSKGRTLANNLARADIESLKSRSYYNLLVTTDTTHQDTRFNPPITYDNDNYLPQTVTDGGITYTRYNRIDFALQQGAQISTAPWASDDTGLKQLSTYVIWQEEGQWKSVELHNLTASPSAVQLTGSFQGHVQDTGGSSIPGALVQVLGHANWRTFTDAGGNYGFSVSPGTYTLVASTAGYFSQNSPLLTVISNNITTYPFALTSMSSGTAVGLIYRQDHLVISAVAVATDATTTSEYIELYNPTSDPINVGIGDPSQLSYMPNVQMTVSYYDATNTLAFSYLTFISTYVPSSSYYLIANTTTVHVNGAVRQADAVYYNPLYMSPSKLMPVSQAGGLVLSVKDPVLGWIVSDKVSWASGGVCPATPMEFACVPTLAGIGPDEIILRKTGPTGSVLTAGRGYDTDDNSQDWIDVPSIPTAPGAKTVPGALCPSGTPALNALVNVNDPLSSVGRCQPVVLTAGHPPAYCSFSMPGIATGTWTVDVVSTGTAKNLFAEYTNFISQANVSTGVPNALTSPAWTTVGATTTLLSQSTSYAFISGHVYDINLNPLARIKVTTGLGKFAFTDAQGQYFLLTDPGATILSANAIDADMDRAYVTQSLPSETLAAGQYYDGSTWPGNGSNFILSEAGIAAGFFQTPAGMPLPNEVAVIFDGGGTQVGQATSDNTGHFYLTDLSTGTYTLQPTLDPVENATPASISVTITGGVLPVSTFTVVNAMSEIQGQVLVNPGALLIKTGVLLVASTSTIAGTVPPPMVGANGALCSPCYYGGSSDGLGAYSLQVPASATPYNVYGWYSKLSPSGAPVINKVGPFSVSVPTPGQVVPQNLTW